MSTEEIQKEKPIATKFSEMKINPKILGIIDHLKFVTPTPIQAKTIPIGLTGSDLIGIAQTGTGKTLAFAIPIIQKIIEEGKLALIVLPTRELAIQVDEVFQKVGSSLGIRTAVLIGGTGYGPQVGMLRRKPNVVIGTPGRILDHLERETIRLHSCHILVLDEADRMLDMGFAPQIKRILKELPPPERRQTMLFSATMPDNIAEMAAKYMKTPVRVEVARAGTVADNIEQEIYFVQKDQKIKLLHKLLEEYLGPVLIFTKTKYGAKKICSQLVMSGFKAAEIHSNKSLFQRREALEGFKAGKYRILVATDIASRGIDVTGIQLIINHDLPENPEDYVHRIGRTGRAGLKGRAISMATIDQRNKVHHIEILTKTKLKVLGEAPQTQFIPEARYQPQIKPRSQFRSPSQSRGRSGSGSYSRPPFQLHGGKRPSAPSHPQSPSGQPSRSSDPSKKPLTKEQEYFTKRHFVNKRRFGGNKPFGKKPFGR